MHKRVVVVGGGLAGFTSAVTAAEMGAEVLLLEARESLGGRARTKVVNGFSFNQGPHALYAGSAGMRILKEFGITPRGKLAPTTGGFGRWHGQMALLPGTSLKALRTPLIGLRAKTQVAGVVARPARMMASETAGLSMAEWIDRQVSDPGARAMLAMLSRLTTYVDDLADFAADAAVFQLASGLAPGVFYLDGGWAQLVDALRVKAIDVGVKIDTETKVESLSDVVDADAVVLAVGGPAQVAGIVGAASAVTARWSSEAKPALATCLDLGLSRLPFPERVFCQDLELPLYFSVHTASAELAPEGAALLHVMRVGSAADDVRGEIEEFIDQVQPGWREVVMAEQYGRQLVVSHDRPRPDVGIAGRPGPAIPDCPGVFVAGDWVGAEGMLADASFASGVAAARSALV